MIYTINEENLYDYRAEQLTLFYAPMVILLEESKQLYNNMLLWLAKDNPRLWTHAFVTDKLGCNKLLISSSAGEPKKEFRLLDHFYLVVKNKKAFALAESIMEAGSRMRDIILTQGSHAFPKAYPVLGEYLAHFEALSAAYNQIEETQDHLVGKQGLYFPRMLPQAIYEGYEFLTDFLDKYTVNVDEPEFWLLKQVRNS